jgi:hypothetical protein
MQRLPLKDVILILHALVIVQKAYFDEYLFDFACSNTLRQLDRDREQEDWFSLEP